MTCFFPALFPQHSPLKTLISAVASATASPECRERTAGAWSLISSSAVSSAPFWCTDPTFHECCVGEKIGKPCPFTPCLVRALFLILGISFSSLSGKILFPKAESVTLSSVSSSLFPESQQSIGIFPFHQTTEIPRAGCQTHLHIPDTGTGTGAKQVFSGYFLRSLCKKRDRTLKSEASITL